MGSAIIFGTRISPYVEKVLRAFWWKRVPVRLVAPRSPLELARWNPQTGKIPVVELAGERLHDSTLIVRRLEALHPDPPLLAADPAVAAAQRVLEDWCDESLYWRTMAERWSPECRAATIAEIVATVPAWARPAARLVLPWRLGRVAWLQGLGRLPRATRLDEYGRLLDDLSTLLGDAPFFHGDRPSIADLALFAQLRCAGAGATPPLAELVGARPRLVAFLARLEATVPEPAARPGGEEDVA